MKPKEKLVDEHLWSVGYKEPNEDGTREEILEERRKLAKIWRDRGFKTRLTYRTHIVAGDLYGLEVYEEGEEENEK
jgi:hypothetical protein